MPSIQELMKERNSLIKKAELVQNCLAGSPDGQIICRKQQGIYRYSLRKKKHSKKEKDEKYLKKNSTLLLDLAKRNYYRTYLKDLQKQLEGLDYYLKCCEEANNLETYLEKHPGIRELVQPALIDRSNKYIQWASADYKRSNVFPENLIFITEGGFYVRSKAEQMIANMYIEEGIPYRYEDPVVLPDGSIIFPDFHLYSLRNYKEYYHEHNGMMLSEKYYNNYEIKLRKLRSAGIIPGVNLLQTFEAEGYPLDPACIKDLINRYLK